MKRAICYVIGLSIVLSACAGAPEQPVIRLGYFPNVTHLQALVGMENGRLAKLTGIPIEPRLFKSGPYAIEALFAGDVDLLYVGPSPAINGFVRSKGKALTVVAGASSGGAVLVLRKGVPFEGAHSLRGLRLASPGIGNTQDVALRTFLGDAGVESHLMTVAASDMPALFLRGDLDGAWVPEPWGSRLVKEAGVQVALDERDLWRGRQFATTLLVVRQEFLQKHPELVRRFLKAHVEVTRWIAANPTEAEGALQRALTRLLGKGLPPEVLRMALDRLDPTYDPVANSLAEMAGRARRLGYLGGHAVKLDGFLSLNLLQEILMEQGLPPLADSPGAS